MPGGRLTRVSRREVCRFTYIIGIGQQLQRVLGRGLGEYSTSIYENGRAVCLKSSSAEDEVESRT